MCPAALPAHDRYGFIIKLLRSKTGYYSGAGEGTLDRHPGNFIYIPISGDAEADGYWRTQP